MGKALLHPALDVVNQSGLKLPVTKAGFSGAIQAFEKHTGRSVAMLEIVFVDEDGIVEINENYLKKNYVTDVITFPYHESTAQAIEGTLYICLPRIKEQAAELNEPQKTELMRVVFHGLLHLNGMMDDTDTLKNAMHNEENTLLSLHRIWNQT